MADTIILMDGGKIQQMAAPEVIYNDPNNIFTAQFIGTPPMNVHEMRKNADYVGYRPEKVQLFCEKPSNCTYVRKVKIITREMLGSETLYKLQILADTEKEGTIMAKSLDMSFTVDEEAYIGIPKEDLYYFDSEKNRIRDAAVLEGLYLATEGEE